MRKILVLLVICVAFTACKKSTEPTQAPAEIENTVEERDDSDGERSYFGGYSSFDGYFDRYSNGQCIFDDGVDTEMLLTCTPEQAKTLMYLEDDRLMVEYFSKGGIDVYSDFEILEKAWAGSDSHYFTGQFTEYYDNKCYFSNEGDYFDIPCSRGQAESFAESDADSWYTIEYSVSDEGIEIIASYPIEAENESEELYIYEATVVYVGGSIGSCYFYLYENYDGYDGSTISFNCAENEWKAFENNIYSVFRIDYNDDSVILSLEAIERLPETSVTFKNSDDDGLCYFDEGRVIMYCNGFGDFPEKEFVIYYIPNVIDDYPVLMGIGSVLKSGKELKSQAINGEA